MSSLPKGKIILTGPNVEVVMDFVSETLTDLVPDLHGTPTLTSKQLLELQKLELVQSHTKCFLVMPCDGRIFIYREGDHSSMYEEIEHMCMNEDGTLVAERGKCLVIRLPFRFVFFLLGVRMPQFSSYCITEMTLIKTCTTLT